MLLTCKRGGGDEQASTGKEIRTHVLEVAVDEGGVDLQYLENRSGLFVSGAAPAVAKAQRGILSRLPHEGRRFSYATGVWECV